MVEPQEHLVSALQDAVAAVDAAGVPEDLRPAAFSKAFDRISGDPPPVRDRAAHGATTPDSDRVDDAIGRIAHKLRLESEVVGRVFDVDTDGVHLTVPRSALPSTRQDAMQEVARLIPAARQAAGIDDEYTALAAVRDACDNRGVLDAHNFARAMQPLDGDGMRFRGPSRSREVKVNAAGYETAADIVRRLAGG
jgi:hypothetical protein